VAVGTGALSSNRTGGSNTAIGTDALEFGQSGSGNTAVGLGAGILATGSNNVYIGAGMSGVGGESNACYIASIFGQTSASGIPVLINSSNKLGTATSSKRFKEDIKPMEKTSEALYALKPVSFRYKKEIDPAGTSQLGLVAEDVEKVDPDLVVRDKDGRAYTVRYDQVNAMLLNEFLKEHKAFLEEQRKVQRLEAALDTVNQRLKEQEEKIERVSSQVETSRPALQVVQVP
jgi:trimeric autotransporter adhesin